jgi:hypothetical protein
MEIRFDHTLRCINVLPYLKEYDVYSSIELQTFSICFDPALACLSTDLQFLFFNKVYTFMVRYEYVFLKFNA